MLDISLFTTEYVLGICTGCIFLTAVAAAIFYLLSVEFGDGSS